MEITDGLLNTTGANGKMNIDTIEKSAAVVWFARDAGNATTWRPYDDAFEHGCVVYIVYTMKLSIIG